MTTPPRHVNQPAEKTSLFDPNTGIDDIALQAGTVTQDPTTGIYYAPAQVAGSFSATLTNDGTFAKESGGNLATLVTNTTGLATASNQSTGNTSLSGMKTDLDEIALDTDNLAGMKTDLDSLVTNTTGIATASNQTTGNTSLSTIATNTNSLNTVEGTTTDAAVTGDNSGTFSAKLRGLSKILSDVWDSVNHRFHVNVDAGSITANAGTNLNTSALALETGGNLASLKTDADSIKTQTAVLLDTFGSTTTINAATTFSGVPTVSQIAANSSVSLANPGDQSTFVAQISITSAFNGTLSFYGLEPDGSTLQLISAHQRNASTIATSTAINVSSATNQVWSGNASGFKTLYVICTTFTSGSSSVALGLSAAPYAVSVTNTVNTTDTNSASIKSDLDTIVTNTNKIPASPAQEGGNLATLAGGVTSSKYQTNLAQVAGNSVATGNNAVPTLNSASTGYVAAYGSNAAALTANTDYLFKWGAGGTTQVNHIMIQNNASVNLLWDLDTATNAGSPLLSNTLGQNTLFLDVQTTVVHIQANGTPNVNGSSGSNIVVRGWI